jgi:hypothetical protein
VLRRKLGHDASDPWQHVNVLMAVEVAHGNAGRTHAPDLCVELAANFGQRDEAAHALDEELIEMRRENAVRPDESRGRRGADQRPVLREHEVHADRKLRARACQRNGVLELRSGCHDGGRRYDSAIVGLDDAAVHGLGNSEIVGVDDELEAAAHRRSANAQCFMPK